MLNPKRQYGGNITLEIHNEDQGAAQYFRDEG
jgi:hypothetical protein